MSDFYSFGGRATRVSEYIRCPRCGSRCAGEEAYKGHPCTPQAMAERAQRESREQGMSNIVLCDRCGKIATAKVAGLVQYIPNPEAESRNFGLCPDCSRELYDFLHSANKDVRAILTPFDPDKERETDGGPTQADTSRAALEAEYGDG